jgi:hypothetical protein
MAWRNPVNLRHISFLVVLFGAALVGFGCADVKSSTPTSPQSVSITVSPTTASVQPSATQKFTAAVSGSSNTAVSWQVNGVAGGDSTHGMIDATGMFKAPAAAPTPATVTVTAVAQADATKTAAAQVTIGAASSAIAVSLNTTAVTVQTGNMTTLTATVQSDSSSQGVTWTLTGAGCTAATCGTLSTATSASGTAITYTAPATVPTPATVTVTATSVADTTKTASATITLTATVTGAVAVTVTPKRAALTTGQAQTFAATVTGSTTTTVTWEVDTVPGGNATVGTISAAGVYTPPASAGTHTVGARAVADSTVSATASVAITDLAGVFTYHNDLSRAGVNAKEYALNTTNVKTGTFGKRFACAIDASAYAQPLWVANVSIGGANHNVVIAATQHNTVYAFDADASPCQTLWSKSLMAAGETWVTSGDVNSDDITPDIGIVGTPVIDPATQTIYVVSKSKTTGGSATFHQRLHALSLTDGTEKFTGPVDINFSSGGHTFDPLRQNERCGLALVNGVVYIAYASHGDTAVYYGWIAGYNASTLAQTSIFNVDPTSSFGGVWMSGGAPAADSGNNLYVITGNGNFNGTTEFGDSFLKLSTGSSMGVLSFFAPSNQADLNANDGDLGAGGATILVDPTSGPVAHLVVGGGKQGNVFVLNRDSLGGNNSTDSGVVQKISVTPHSIFSTPAFWQNTLYISPVNSELQSFALNTTTGQFAPGSRSARGYGFPGATPSISAQGTSNGVVWTIERQDPPGPAILHAHDATNLATELWNSNGTASDKAGLEVKFTVPTIANGKVYVGTATEISVYGLSPN